MEINVKTAMKYSLLPGILPRTRTLFASGFYHIAMFMAYIFNSVRLLPNNHPYLNYENMGRFGIRHVMAEAGSNLVFDRKHIDQIAVFFLFLTGLVLLLLQFVMLIMALLIPHAHAGFAGQVITYFQRNPALSTEHDIAFIMLEYIFGLHAPFNPALGFFDTCLSRGTPCLGSTVVPPPWPTPVHDAIKLLVEFYNTGILAVGIAVLLYFVVVIVAETAQTGTPFGRRFNRLWFPIRLIFAVALMVPILDGFSTAQVMTLRIAKWGGNLASNGWYTYLDNLTAPTPLGDQSTLVATPRTPELNTLLEFIFVAQACKFAEKEMNDRDIYSYLVRDNQDPAVEVVMPFVSTNYSTGATSALEFFNYRDFTIVFGELDPDVTIGSSASDTPRWYGNEKGYVRPICGEITFNVKDLDNPGALLIQEAYYDLVKQLWLDGPSLTYARNIVLRTIPTVNKTPLSALPDKTYYTNLVTTVTNDINTTIQDGVAAEIASGKWAEPMLDTGWGGAALWYNKVAELNGGIYSSVYSLPQPSTYPEIMEYIRKQRLEGDETVRPDEQYSPYLSGHNMIDFRNAKEQYISIALYAAQSVWQDTTNHDIQDNWFKNTVSFIFGLDGLYNMYDNPDIHPLAQLVGIGRSLMESTVFMLGGSIGAGFLSKMFGNEGAKSMAGSAASIAGSVAKIGGVLGFILFYIVPFMPFLYFFFAVGGWVKGIFEAIVGMPLFALAHVRIDGNGLPGPVAMNGYFLLLEILLRPILIVFGLIAALVIFAAQVRVLHDIFQIVASNVAGYDITAPPATGVGSIEHLRQEADQFFFTIMYAVIVYMLGTASFKLIDMIPNHILRWMNAGVSTFGEQSADPAENLIRNMFFGAQMVVSQSSGAMIGLLGRNG